jgi:flavorubredoxin
MYHVSPIPHTNGMMIAYIPKEKILFQSDFNAARWRGTSQRSRQSPGSDS